MNPELDKKLVEKYPIIFKDRYADKPESAMSWGFSCGDGWYDIIDSLCERIQGYVDFTEHEPVVATQVKEKFGGLRFYVNTWDAPIREMISLAEALSLKTCEECGCRGSLTGKSYLRTLCKNCEEKFKNNA